MPLSSQQARGIAEQICPFTTHPPHSSPASLVTRQEPPEPPPLLFPSPSCFENRGALGDCCLDWFPACACVCNQLFSCYLGVVGIIDPNNTTHTATITIAII